MYIFLLLFAFFSIFAENTIIGLKNNLLKQKIEIIINECDDEQEIEKELFKLGCFEKVKVKQTQTGWHISVVERKFIKNIVLIEENSAGIQTENAELKKTIKSFLSQGRYLNYQTLLQAKSIIKQIYQRKGFKSIYFEENFEKNDDGTYELKLIFKPRKHIPKTRIKFIGLNKMKSEHLEGVCSKRVERFMFIFSLPKFEVLNYAQDMQAIIAYAHKMGFLNFKITDAFVETSYDTITLYFVVDEGECEKIVGVTVDNEIYNIKSLPIVASERNIEDILRQIKSDYNSDAQYTLKKTDIGYILAIKTKSIKRNIIKKIIVKGNYTLASVLMDVLDIKQGMFLSYEEVMALKQKASAIETVENIEIITKLSVFNEINKHEFDTLEIYLTEKVKASAGLKVIAMGNSIKELRENFGINLHYLNKNFLGKNQKLGLDINIQNSKALLEIMNSNPRFFNRDIEVIYKFYILNEYQSVFGDDGSEFFRKTDSYFSDGKDLGFKFLHIQIPVLFSFNLNKYLNYQLGINLSYMKKKDIAVHPFNVTSDNKLFPIETFNLPELSQQFEFKYGKFDMSFSLIMPIKIVNNDWENLYKYFKFNFIITNYNKLHHASKLYLRTISSAGTIINRPSEVGIYDNFDSSKVKGFDMSLYEKYLYQDKTNFYKNIGAKKFFANTIELVLPLEDKFIDTPNWLKVSIFSGLYIGSLWDSGVNDNDIVQFKLEGANEFYIRSSCAFGIRLNISFIKLESGYIYAIRKHANDRFKSFYIKAGLGYIELN